ncbi:MAG: hypothetical protein ACKPKO_10415, partial [Candidatus Fonsibacter sp.]
MFDDQIMYRVWRLVLSCLLIIMVVHMAESGLTSFTVGAGGICVFASGPAPQTTNVCNATRAECTRHGCCSCGVIVLAT